ncbi:MAG: hypothetical protein V1761_04100 [bacterium]
MKKGLLATIVMLMFLLSIPTVKADDYQSYQEIVFIGDGGFLLQDYTETDYSTYLATIAGKRFIGWKVAVVTKLADVDFVSETKLKVYNNGYSTIKHDITLNTKIETKYQISASGSIGIKVKGSVKKFDGTLDADIKAEVSYSQTTTDTETYEFNIIVDPGTYVTIVMKGTGVVSNGVARHYFFWIKTKEGGWETFTVTTEYYEIIKDKIR